MSSFYFHAGRWPAIGVALSILLGTVELARSSPGDLIELAESEYYRDEASQSLRSYKEGLLAIRALPAAERRALEPEVEIALRRSLALSARLGQGAETLEVFEVWSRDDDSVDAGLRALATYYSGVTSMQISRGEEEVRRIWKTLGFLEKWYVIGSFDNERGGGFSTVYGPETEIDLSKSYDGKKRAITWRELPARPYAGRVEFNAMFRPNDECLAYALTFVQSEFDTSAALRFGSDEGYKIWVNGVLHGEEDVQRTRGFDQTAVGIKLRKGWNSILFKVTESTDAWVLQARLTALNGSAISTVLEGRPGPEELSTLAGDFAAARKAKKTEKIAPPPDALQALLHRLSDGEADARSHYVAGTLLLERNAHDSSEHPDTDLIRKAIDLDAAPAAYHLALARSLERRSVIAAERDDNEWREAMEQAAKRGAAIAAYELSRYYHRTFGNLHRSREHLDRALELNPASAAFIYHRGLLESAIGYPLASLQAQREAEKAEPESIRSLLGVADRRSREGKVDEAIELYRQILARNQYSRGARSSLASILLAVGQKDEAVAVLREESTFRPYSVSLHTRLARLALGRDQGAEAAKHLAAALEICPENFDLLKRQGEAYWEAEQRDDAFASWERSVELQPNQPELRERLDFLKSSRPRFEEEFRRDLSTLIDFALKNPPDASANDPAKILFDLRAVQVNQDGTTREFAQTTIQVLNDQGVRMFDRHSSNYSASEQTLEFKKARVYRKDGTQADARLTHFGGRGQFGGGGGGYSRGSVDLPTLSPGDVVEVQWIREDITQSFFGDYFGRREFFQQSLAIDEKVFSLRVPAERKFYFHTRNLDIEPGIDKNDETQEITYTWTKKDIAKVDMEPAMPAGKEVFPLLEISTFENWATFSSWYSNLIKKQFESSPEITAKVRELVSGKETELEKIRALYNFVVTDVRYNAWEFGVHGFKPYNASTVFARRFGDCKDKATLMTVMLTEVGVSSMPVLIYADQRRGEEDLSLPMVNHFNHCITYVPASDDRPELFLDGTASFHSMEELPSMDRGARVLVVERDEAELHTIPWNHPRDLSLDEEWTVDVRAEGDADITLRLRSQGDFGVGLRRAFEVSGQRKTQLEQIFGRRFAGAEISSEHFSDLGNLDESVAMSVDLKVPRFLTDSAAGPSISLPEDFYGTGGMLGSITGLEKRQFDVIFGNPRKSRLKVIYRLPDGLRVKSVPEARNVNSRFGRFRLSFTQEPDRLILERLIEITATRVTTADYAQLREFVTSVERMKNEKIILERS